MDDGFYLGERALQKFKRSPLAELIQLSTAFRRTPLKAAGGRAQAVFDVGFEVFQIVGSTSQFREEFFGEISGC